jgi:D-alanyl-D-alanine endopeptidase (penicillin-binding protein 7)
MTKVMTGLVFLENNPDLSREVLIVPADVRAASTTYLKSNERVRLEDLMHLLLIASDNAAARALARVSPHGSEGFVVRMMEKAIELGLESTSFADPSGLDANNVSSAYDMARLITYAVGNEHMSQIMQKPSYQLTTNRHTITIHSTNKLLGGDLDVQGGKTGFIRQAGYCLATLFKLPQGQQVAVVVLGARNSMSRFWETRHLFQWLSSKTTRLVAGATVP